MPEIISLLNHNEGALSVILSAFSLIAAIGIPAIIAHRQNKIALYEKRLDCYQSFEALKNFSNFCSRFDTFEKQTEFDPIFQCQRKYLDIHGILNDEQKAQCSIVQNAGSMYAMSCLDEDSTMLRSIGFLTKGIDESTFGNIEVTLNEFVRGLFGAEKDIRELKLLQLQFTATIKSADKCCETMRKNMKVYWNIFDFRKFFFKKSR